MMFLAGVSVIAFLGGFAAAGVLLYALTVDALVDDGAECEEVKNG